MATQKVTLPVKGMHCAACVRRVEKALAGLDGVTVVKVNLIAGKADVEYAPERATLEQLKDAVRSEGFQVPS